MALALFFCALGAAQIPKNDQELKRMIGRMLIVGFEGEMVTKDSQIVLDIQKYDLGGVILFDRHYHNPKKIKNISSKTQLKELTSSLRSFAKKPLLLSVDQEGGRVARLKPSYGFDATPSAKVVGEMDEYMTNHVYNALARTLNDAGINCDFAPVVDLALNPQNKVIIGLKRSYSDDPKEVVKHSKIFLNSLQNRGIIGVLKHFPGHGSSSGDTHEGFVDVSGTWSEKELEPYIALIDEAPMIMTAHIFNSKLDEKYPATLSYKINTSLLRGELGFGGVVVSDDMQMGAISKHYDLKESVTLAINAGVDMLLFANQLSQIETGELVDAIFAQVKAGAVPQKRIIESNKRIELLHTKISASKEASFSRRSGANVANLGFAQIAYK